MAEKQYDTNETFLGSEKQKDVHCDPNEAPGFIMGDKNLEAFMKWDF